MNAKELKDMIELDEKQDTELKESFHAKEISKTTCAFGNLNGGNIIFGVNSRREITGLQGNLDSLQRTIEGAIQRVDPTPLHEINRLTVDDKEVIIATIQKIGETVCTFEGSIYLRVGSTNQKLEGHSFTDFFKERSILCFDTTPSNAKISDIEVNKINDYLKRRSLNVSMTPEDLLISLQLATKNGKFTIKNAGILSFGHPETRFPQNEIRLVKFAGSTPVDVERSDAINYSPIKAIEKVVDFVKSNTKTQIIIEGLERIQKTEYPLAVVREAIVNAVSHRDYFSNDSIQISVYSDRLEVISPGSLPKGLTMDKLGTLSVKRNPLTYRILRDAKFMEGIGTGIPRMFSEMRKHKLPDPKFEDLGNFFKVTLYNEISLKRKIIDSIEDLNERQKRAISYLKTHKVITSQTYLKINDVSLPTAVKDLNEMINFGFLKKHGAGPSTAYYLKAN